MTTVTTRPPSVLLATSLPTPAGLLGVVLDADGTVRAAGFGPLDGVLARGRLTDGALEVRVVPPADLLDLPGPSAVVAAVERYVAGEAGALDAVPVRQPGGAFFQEVWRQMRHVPPGVTVSYTELAAAAGRPAAVRAAGSACARNLVAPFVPCHRIVKSDGTLGGYAYGLDAKRALLAHERASVPRSSPQLSSTEPGATPG